MSKVIVVQEARWQFLKDEYSEGLIKLMRIWLADGAEIVAAKTYADAQELLSQEKISALVFVSRNMIKEAREAKDNYPGVNVVILTGSVPAQSESKIPFDGLVFVDKLKTVTSGKAGGELIRKAILAS